MATILTGSRKFHVNSAAYATTKDAATGITSASAIETTDGKWDKVGAIEFRIKPGTKSAKQHRAVAATGQASEWVTSRDAAVAALAALTN